MISVARHCRLEPVIRDALLRTHENSNILYTPALLSSP